MDILKLELFADDIQVRYTDGSREEIQGGIYERKDRNGDTVEQRPATQSDADRMTALAEAYEDQIKPLDAVVVRVQIVGTHIDVDYDNGFRESIEAGIYEIKDANNDTIFERAATSVDMDRLLSLDVGELGNGTPSGSGPIIIDGTAGDDDLEGTVGADTLNGLDGDDKIRGRGGDDEVNGGNGDDRVRGDLGNDTVDGGAGNDRARGGLGNDVVRGGEGDDRVKGDVGNDMVYGDAGNDRVRGGLGDDTVSGGLGDDRVDGQAGNDLLDGGDGRDTYNGGLGSDTFVFGVDGDRDRIKDFEDGQDTIDISAFAVANSAELTMTQVGLNVLIDLGGGDVIRVDNTMVEQLSDADFIF